MNRLRRLGIRTRLTVTLSGVALISVGLAMLLFNSGLESRLNQFARDRLAASARHSSELAVGYYVRDRGWSQSGVKTLNHLAQMNGYQLSIFDRNGKQLIGPPSSAPKSKRANAAVRVDEHSVGTVTVSPLNGQVFTHEDSDLHSRLNRLNLLAGALAVGLGIIAALLVATPLARPIRRVTDVARQIEHGDLNSRVEPGGGEEIEQLGHALNRLAETLQHEEEIRRGAAADIAHELRTPLTGIISRIEAAQDSVLADEPQNLEAMRAEAMRLKRLIEDLERLAEAERPGLLVQKSRINLAELVAARARSNAYHFEKKGISFRHELSPITIDGDKARLEQIIDNLLANALQYTSSGGEVVLRIRTLQGEAVIEVSDTGIGIPAEDLPSIFDRFWRGEKSRSRATGGAGIGLAIVRELVRAHQGRIEVDSTPAEGSTFRIVLPTPT